MLFKFLLRVDHYGGNQYQRLVTYLEVLVEFLE